MSAIVPTSNSKGTYLSITFKISFIVSAFLEEEPVRIILLRDL